MHVAFVASWAEMVTRNPSSFSSTLRSLNGISSKGKPNPYSLKHNVLTWNRLIALIELADSVFALQQVVICLDRSVPEADAKAFMKSLRWVGFELITLDMWANERDVTSDKWLLLGMEV